MHNMNRKADASIVVLVLLSVLLLGAALYIFNTNNNRIVSEIKDVRSLNGIYLKESQLNFYINEAIDLTVSNGYVGASGFVLGLKNNLRRFDNKDILVSEDLLRVAEELKEGNVKVDGGILVDVNTQIVDKNDEIIITQNYRGLFIR